MIRVTHFSTVHPASDNRLFNKECPTLSEAGYDVTLVAVKDNAPAPTRFRLLASPRENRRLRRMLFGPWRALATVLSTRPAICHFHDSELIPVGVVLKLLGCRVVYDVHEDLSAQIQDKDYLPPIVRPVLGLACTAIERLGGLFFDAVVAATPAIAAKFPPAKTVIVQNFPLTDELVPVGDVPFSQRPPHIAYVGVATRQRGLLDMVRAVGLLEDKPDVRLRFAGKCYPPELADEAAALPGWSRVVSEGWLSRDGIGSMLADCRLGLVLFHQAQNHVRAQPNKLFEYMAAGLPVVASDFPLWRDIINEAGCGLLVDPTNPAAIAAAVRRLLDNPAEAEAMGRRGREAVSKRYNWDVEAGVLLDLYRRLSS